MLERIDNPDGSYLLVTYLNEHEVVISEFNASGEMVRRVAAFGGVGA